MAPTHLLQHLFAVVAQRLAGDKDDRNLGLRASTDGKARTLQTHEHLRSAHDVVHASTPSAHVVYEGGCMPNDDVGEIF